MTPEEAIIELLQTDYLIVPFDNTPEECNKVYRKREAIRVAIKALEFMSRSENEGNSD